MSKQNFFSSLFGQKKNSVPSIPDIFSFFGIREFKDDSVILLDGSWHGILDVEPLLQKKALKKEIEVIDRYKKFLDDLDFNIKICVRNVNCNIGAKLKMVRERTIDRLKSANKFGQITEFREFMDWLEEFVHENCSHTKKRYIVVSAHTDDKKMTQEQLKIRLNSKINYIINGLSTVGIKEIIRLNDSNLENLFNSYLRLSFFFNDDYTLMPEMVHLYKLKRGQEKIASKKALSKELSERYNKIKEYIQRNKAAYKTDLEKLYGGLKDAEKTQLNITLQNDENIGIFGDIYKYIFDDSVKKQSGNLYDSVQYVDFFQEDPNYLKIGSTYMRCFTSTAYPEEASKKHFLENVMDIDSHIDLTLDIDVEAKHNVSSYYSRKNQELEMQLAELRDKGYVSEELVKIVKTNLTRIAELKKMKIFKLSMYYMTEGGNLDELNSMDSKLHTLTRANSLFIKPVINNQVAIFKTLASLDANYLTKTVRDVVTTSELLACAFPFRS